MKRLGKSFLKADNFLARQREEQRARVGVGENGECHNFCVEVRSICFFRTISSSLLSSDATYLLSFLLSLSLLFPLLLLLSIRCLNTKVNRDILKEVKGSRKRGVVQATGSLYLPAIST